MAAVERCRWCGWYGVRAVCCGDEARVRRRAGMENKSERKLAGEFGRRWCRRWRIEYGSLTRANGTNSKLLRGYKRARCNARNLTIRSLSIPSLPLPPPLLLLSLNGDLCEGRIILLCPSLIEAAVCTRPVRSSVGCSMNDRQEC